MGQKMNNISDSYYDEDGVHEECGVFGVYDLDGGDVASTIYYGLFALQHRGQESCGIAVSDTNGPKGKVLSHKDMGLVNEVFTPEDLEKLKGKPPIIEAILDYRAMTKLKSTYADGLVKQIADDGRIHTTFQNLVTATGRLSSTDPNLQNIPVRTELGSEIRRMFVPSDGCVFVDADYSQIELRVLAHIADDKTMQEAFRSGFDIHTATAAQVFGVEPEQVTPLMRRHAKAVNFGIVYGISEFSLSEDIGVTRKEARQYIDNYLAHYAGVRTYMHEIVEQAKRDGYVTTLFGRRRELPELKSSNFNIRSFGERVALNTPIQGTAADIIKLAMIRVDAALRRQKLKARLVLQVHDELIVECPVKEAEQVKKIVTAEMENVVQLKVPLLAEAKSGASWYEAK